MSTQPPYVVFMNFEAGDGGLQGGAVTVKFMGLDVNDVDATGGNDWGLSPSLSLPLHFTDGLGSSVNKIRSRAEAAVSTAIVSNGHSVVDPDTLGYRKG